MVVDPWPNNAIGGYSRTGTLLVAQNSRCPHLKYEHIHKKLKSQNLRPSTVSGTSDEYLDLLLPCQNAAWTIPRAAAKRAAISPSCKRLVPKELIGVRSLVITAVNRAVKWS